MWCCVCDASIRARACVCQTAKTTGVSRNAQKSADVGDGPKFKDAHALPPSSCRRDAQRRHVQWRPTASLRASFTLGVFLLNRLLVLLLCRTGILVQHPTLDKGFGIRAMRDLIVELVLEHAPFELRPATQVSSPALGQFMLLSFSRARVLIRLAAAHQRRAAESRPSTITYLSLVGKQPGCGRGFGEDVL